MKTIKLFDKSGNKSIGVFHDHQGFLALTFAESKTFKTEKGAFNWLAKRGYEVKEAPVVQVLAKTETSLLGYHYQAEKYSHGFVVAEYRNGELMEYKSEFMKSKDYIMKIFNRVRCNLKEI